MKKELLLAISIGIILGFTTTGFFWAKKQGKISFLANNNQERKKHQQNNNQTITPTAQPAKEENKEKNFLEITEPENEAIFQQEKVAIKGKTISRGTIIIIWEEGEEILLANENGEFESEISLVGGENEIEIFAYDDHGSQISKTLTIIYSTAKF